MEEMKVLLPPDTLVSLHSQPVNSNSNSARLLIQWKPVIVITAVQVKDPK